MKLYFLIFFLIHTLSFAQAQSDYDDFEIVSQLLVELEQRDWFPEDIYPKLPPPPESREYFIELRDDLTPEQADSLFSRIEVEYEQHLKKIGERTVDSSVIYMATKNYLSGSKCKECGIKPDTLLIDPAYSRYKYLIKQLAKGKTKDLNIPFEVLNYKGKYKLKSVDEFPSRQEMYNGTLAFLSGGEINFSRFYQREDLGLIYFSTSVCQTDCAAGYIVLYEQKNSEWKIFDILLQWIN